MPRTAFQQKSAHPKCAALLVLVGALLFPALARSQNNLKSGAKSHTLRVKLNYTGAGTVDDKHKIYVMVTDSDPFTSSTLTDISSNPAARPNVPEAGPGSKVCYVLARVGVSENGQIARIAGLAVSPVYVVAFFDQHGTYSPETGPVAGSPMGVYGLKPDQPVPVQLGKTKSLKIELVFGDSSTIP